MEYFIMLRLKNDELCGEDCSDHCANETCEAVPLFDIASRSMAQVEANEPSEVWHACEQHLRGVILKHAYAIHTCLMNPTDEDAGF
jgi:hypothetical protein